MSVYFSTSGPLPTPLQPGAGPANAATMPATSSFGGVLAARASATAAAAVGTPPTDSLSAYYFRHGIDPDGPSAEQQARALAWLDRVAAERAEAALGVTPQRASELKHLHEDHWWRSEYEHRPEPVPGPAPDPLQAAPGEAYDEAKYWALRTRQLGFDPRNPPLSDFAPAADWSPVGQADAFGNPRLG